MTGFIAALGAMCIAFSEYMTGHLVIGTISVVGGIVLFIWDHKYGT